MKIAKIKKLFNMVVSLVIIGFVISACSENNPPEEEAVLPGYVFISNEKGGNNKNVENVVVATTLFAFYEGSEAENVSFQWQKNGRDIPKADSESYDANDVGIYNVIASRPGYRSIASNKIDVGNPTLPGGSGNGGGTGGETTAVPLPIPVSK